MADFAAGTVLADRFIVTGVLGRGGMATVYLVEDQIRQVPVALKVLHDHLAADSSMRRRLRREVEAAGRVRHEAALVANELYEVGSTLALSMPFHGGQTLATHVADRGPLPPAEVRALGIRVAGALAEAHRHGVLHHDVTANNILLESGSDAVLTDFGLARFQDGNTSTATTIMGTPGFAAPEIYDGTRSDPRSDLYSLGALLYVAATGELPFGKGNPAGVLRRQLDQDFTPPSEASPDLPPDLAATICSLLARDPSSRPPSATEVADALSDRTPAYVPSSPDTWNLTEVTPSSTSSPTSSPTPAVHTPAVATPPEIPQLPEGSHSVVVSRGLFSDAQPDGLATAVARVSGLPPDALEQTPALGARKLRLVRGVDAPTARRLADAAETLGYQAKVFDDSPLSPVESAARFFWVPIPILWIAFGLLVDAYHIEAVLLPVVLTLTILLSTVVPMLFLRPVAPKGAPLAYGADLTQHVDASRVPVLAAAPEPTETQETADAREPTLVLRTRASLDALGAAVDASELPTPARRDLEATLTALRTQAEELSVQVTSLMTALAAEPEPADVSWAHQRLVRLDTLEAGGQVTDAVERERLMKALGQQAASEEAREALDSRLAATMAQLLEIAATAERSRRELLVTDAQGPATGHPVVERLQREVDSVGRARRELAARMAQRQRG